MGWIINPNLVSTRVSDAERAVVEELCPFGERELSTSETCGGDVQSVSPRAWHEALMTRREEEMSVIDARIFMRVASALWRERFGSHSTVFAAQGVARARRRRGRARRRERCVHLLHRGRAV